MVAVTLLVPLWSVQMDWSMSTLSPNEYGKAGPLEMADATADLRKSMSAQLCPRNQRSGLEIQVLPGLAATLVASLPDAYR
jgi:hypothetical protein